MLMTWADVLLDLPVDGVLRQFFEQEGLSVPSTFQWVDTTVASRKLMQLVLDDKDSALRDRVTTKLAACSRLDHLKGRQAMFEVATSLPHVRSSLAHLRSDLQRALWLSMDQPVLYEQANELCHFDMFEDLGQQFDLGIKAVPDTADHAVQALESELSDFYLRKRNAGQACVSFIHERENGVYFLGLRLKDLSSLRLEFEDGHCIRRESNPCISLSLEYSSHTGVARTLVQDGVEFHQALLKAFVKHHLKVSDPMDWLPPPTLDLSKLMLGFVVPKAVADGFNMMRVRTLTLISPDHQLRVDCCALENDGETCVTSLLNDKMPEVVEQGWMISAAQIDFYRPPIIGRIGEQIVTVVLTRRGRLNLPRFDRVLQTQLEGYLLAAGVMHPNQTLSVIEGSGMEDVDA